MLPHVAALSRHTLRQMGSAKLLSHLAAQSPWHLSSDWNAFTDSDSKSKAERPLAQKRRQAQEVTKQYVKKRPAFKRPAEICGKSKLTAFTQPRESALRIMGKKSNASLLPSIRTVRARDWLTHRLTAECKDRNIALEILTCARASCSNFC